MRAREPEMLARAIPAGAQHAVRVRGVSAWNGGLTPRNETVHVYSTLSS